MQGTWLPIPKIMEEKEYISDIHHFLSDLDGNMRLMVCSYDESVLDEYVEFTDEKALYKNTLWDLIFLTKKGDEESLDITAEFKVNKGMMESGGVAIALDFHNWNEDNYIMVPSAVYNGNRHRVYPVVYPPFIYKAADRPLGMPTTITNVPHLNVDKSPAKIELLTGNAATPMFSFYNPQKKKGWIMLTEQGTSLGNSGLIIEENLEQNKVTFVLSAPGVRETRYAGGHLAKSVDKGVKWNEGDKITLKFKMYCFDAKDIHSFYNKYLTVRKELTGTNKYNHVAPFSAITDIILKHHDKYKWFESDSVSYICNKPENNSPFAHLQSGWSGLPVYGFPFVIQLNRERIRRVSHGFDALLKMQGESGLISAILKRGELFGDNFNEQDISRDISMLRRSGEVLYFGIQTLEIFKKQGLENEIKKKWKEMFKVLSDGLVKLFNDYGEFGQFVDVKTGKLYQSGSTNSAICIAGLASSAQYFNETKYLDTAIAAGTYYFNRDVSSGYIGGGPAEILQCQDSESTFGLCESYTVLYEITKDEKWLERARQTVAQLSTWVVSYDYKFPKGSRFNELDINATGSVIASIQNAHSAPGMYIISGNFLLRLYRATNDKRYMEMLKDLAHNVVQYTTTPTQAVIPNGLPGSVSERVNLSDWEGATNIGGNLPYGDTNMAWETVTLLSIMQNPGIYIRNDIGYMEVFDNVEVELLKKKKNGVAIRVSNPTSYPAKISILSENEKQSKLPLDKYFFLDLNHINVKAGERKEFFIANDGHIH